MTNFRKTLTTILTTATLASLATATVANASPTTATMPSIVFDVTGTLGTADVGTITGDLTVRVTTVDGRPVVTAQYRDADEWYSATPCATEDSTACVWIGPARGNGLGAIVINSRQES